MSALASQIRPDLIDRLIALYCDWREESAEVHAAYERFSGASASDRALAFAAYTAALDREDSAAQLYADHLTRITSRVADDSGAGPNALRHWGPTS